MNDFIKDGAKKGEVVNGEAWKDKKETNVIGLSAAQSHFVHSTSYSGHMSQMDLDFYTFKNNINYIDNNIVYICVSWCFVAARPNLLLK